MAKNKKNKQVQTEDRENEVSKEVEQEAVPDEIVSFANVSKRYANDSVGLEEVTFTIKPYEMVSIVGHSGAGKTTILKMLLAEDRPTEGDVFFETANVHKLRQKAVTMLRKRIGTVFQNFRLLPHKTAYENIAFAMEAAGRNNEDIASDVPQVLDLVGLQDKMDSYPHELSGGQKQRVAIARAIVNQPDLIIADEPTGNLDPINTYEIVQILKKINDYGTTVMLTTHNKGVVDSLGGRVITMEDGKITRDDDDGQYSL